MSRICVFSACCTVVEVSGENHNGCDEALLLLTNILLWILELINVPEVITSLHCHSVIIQLNYSCPISVVHFLQHVFDRVISRQPLRFELIAYFFFRLNSWSVFHMQVKGIFVNILKIKTIDFIQLVQICLESDITVMKICDLKVINKFFLITLISSIEEEFRNQFTYPAS